jgi:hypothetical protein
VAIAATRGARAHTPLPHRSRSSGAADPGSTVATDDREEPVESA